MYGRTLDKPSLNEISKSKSMSLNLSVLLFVLQTTSLLSAGMSCDRSFTHPKDQADLGQKIQVYLLHLRLIFN